MRKQNSKNFVHVRCATLQEQSITLGIPVNQALRLQERGIIYETCTQPEGSGILVLDPAFDDLALAIPGAFLIRS